MSGPSSHQSLETLSEKLGDDSLGMYIFIIAS